MTDKSEPRLHGTYAEFDSVEPLLAACRRVRDAGYVKTDAFTPFPVHGIEKALGIKATVLPWIALCAGLTGTTIAVSMQIWMNSINYPYIISGKPFISMPAFIPVSFELTVLLAAFGAFFGMLALNRLPQFSNPVFTDPRFDRATDDRFFLLVEATDPKYDKVGIAKLFGDFGSSHVSDIYHDTSSAQIPKPFFIAFGLLLLVSTLPPLIIARMRVTNSDSPRYHVFYEMDFSPAKDSQVTSTLFADGRSMRPDVPGTVAVGQFDEAIDFYTGIDMDKLTQLDAPRASRLVRALLDGPGPQEGADSEEGPAPQDGPASLEGDVPAVAEETSKDSPVAEEASEPADEPVAPASEPADVTVEPADAPVEPVDEAGDEPAKSVDEPAKPVDEVATEPAMKKLVEDVSSVDASAASPASAGTGAVAAPAAVVDTTPWLKENPLPLTAAVIARGRERFEIYCAVCHGNDGRGNGLVNRRAQKLLSSAWVQPSSLHQDTLYAIPDADGKIPYADGKLFNTITNGIRKMPGYASQIPTRDRWAIVAYVRALQASQNATLEDLPADKRTEVKKLQDEVTKRLAELAELERKKAEAATAAAAAKKSL